MRYVAYIFVTAISFTIPFAASVSAEILDDSLFGQHVSDMAPAHPQTHGQLFAECVVALATTGDCPHHEEM